MGLRQSPAIVLSLCALLGGCSNLSSQARSEIATATASDAVSATPVIAYSKGGDVQVPWEEARKTHLPLPLTYSTVQAVFDEARDLVASRSGTSLDGLELRLVDDRVIDQEVREETRHLVGAQFSSDRYAAHFVDKLMASQSGTFLALYSARRNTIFASKRLLDRFVEGIDNPAVARDALLALMIHESVHAADDRRHDINAVRTLDFRAAFAQSAIFEGHAQWQTRQLCTHAGCLEGLKAMDTFMFGGARPNQAVQPTAALSRNVIEYAYVEGERFIDSLASRGQGSDLLEKLLSDPPVDPIQILDPQSWPNTEREQRNRRLIQSLNKFEHPWNDARYTRVQTSPLRGVNLRADPSRRAAAVDGFTRLLTAMAAVEIHDVRDTTAVPTEVTLLEGLAAETATLFANTLHANNRARNTIDSDSSERIGNTTLLRTSRRIDTSNTNTGTSKPESNIGPKLGPRFGHTLVAVNGRHVIQIAAVEVAPSTLDAYAKGVLEHLARAAKHVATQTDELASGRFVNSATSTSLR